MTIDNMTLAVRLKQPVFRGRDYILPNEVEYAIALDENKKEVDPIANWNDVVCYRFFYEAGTQQDIPLVFVKEESDELVLDMIAPM